MMRPNSVIILFVTDVDEMVYEIVNIINHCWAEELTQQQRGEIQGLVIEIHDVSSRPEKRNVV